MWRRFRALRPRAMERPLAYRLLSADYNIDHMELALNSGLKEDAKSCSKVGVSMLDRFPMPFNGIFEGSNSYEQYSGTSTRLSPSIVSAYFKLFPRAALRSLDANFHMM